MKTGADMKPAGKTLCVFVLLAITKVMRTVEIEEVLATVGSSFELTCPPNSTITMVTWKINPKVGGPCILAYRTDQKRINTTNCSDSMNWKFRTDRNPALKIWQVGISHEGRYTCEVAAQEGNFHETYQLTVLVPPRLTLYCDHHGNPVCKPAAGKPAAQISWAPEGNSTCEEEGHDNGTVTVLSRFTEHSTSVINATCFVSHPAGNQSKSIACSLGKTRFTLLISIAPCLLSVITIMAVIFSFKVHRDRLCHRTKPPETAPTHSPQDDTMEVEPYTTYVHKENVIYNSVSDLTVGQNLPQGLSPAT